MSTKSRSLQVATIKYSQPIGIIQNSNELPSKFKLHQNYPNPFNGVTIITYELPLKSFTELNIYDMIGRVVKTLVNKWQNASYYSIVLDTENLSTGIYFYQLRADFEIKDTKKLVLIK